MKRTSNFKAAFLALVALVAVGSTGCIIHTDDGPDSALTVENVSDWVLYELYVTDERSYDWGPELLRRPLYPGEAITVYVDCGYYDVLVVDELGAECRIDGLDLCFDDAVWAITNGTLSTCPIFR